MQKRKSPPDKYPKPRQVLVDSVDMDSQDIDPNKSSSQDELKRKRLTEVRDKIDRGLKQLDEGHAISANDALARLRRTRGSKRLP
jgi:hypothetical protein